MIEIPKVVFTKTLNKSEWINTDLATGDLKDEINKLKSQMAKTSSFTAMPHSIPR